MTIPKLTRQDLSSLKYTFQQTSKALSSAAGHHQHNIYRDWEKGKGAPTINEYFAITAHCGLTPSESFDWLTATNKDETIALLYQLVRNRKPVVLTDQECP